VQHFKILPAGEGVAERRQRPRPTNIVRLPKQDKAVAQPARMKASVGSSSKAEDNWEEF
jgi:hypothetical protein